LEQTLALTVTLPPGPQERELRWQRSISLFRDVPIEDLKMMNTACQLGAQSFLTKPLDKRDFCDLLARTEGISMDGCG